MSTPTSELLRVRRFITSAGGIAILEHGAVLLISLITFTILLRRFGLEMVGLWTLLTALLNYSHVADVWSKGVLSFIGEERGRGAASDAAAYASTTITTGSLGYLILMAGGGVFLYLFAPTIVPPEHVGLVHRILPMLILAYWLISVSGNFLQAFVGFGFPALRAAQKIGGAVLLLVSILLMDPSRSLAGIVLAQVLQGLFMVLFGIICFYFYVVRDIPHKLWDSNKLRNLFKFGLKLLAMGSVQLAIEPMIKILLSQFGGLGIVAILEFALRLIMGVRGVILSLGQVVVTAFARQRGTEEACELEKNFVNITHVFLISSLITFALLFSAAPILSFLILDSETSSRSHEVFPIILLMFGSAWIANSVVSACFFLLLSLRTTWPLFLSEILRAGIILVLGYPAGEAFGVDGVMSVVLLAFLVSSGYLFIKTHRVMKIALSETLLNSSVTSASAFIPFMWSLGMTILWIMTPTVSNSALLFTGYAAALLSTFFLVIRFGRLRFLIKSVTLLKP